MLHSHLIIFLLQVDKPFTLLLDISIDTLTLLVQFFAFFDQSVLVFAQNRLTAQPNVDLLEIAVAFVQLAQFVGELFHKHVLVLLDFALETARNL